MAKMIILVGPPGSGKSTHAKQCEANGFVRISQDDQGKNRHKEIFAEAGRAGKDIIVDRRNFSKQQRSEYLTHAKIHGYETEIITIHESYETCLRRVLARTDHPTIKDEKDAYNALQIFFSKYERPTEDEADVLTFIYPQGNKPKIVVCDLDGTLCDVEHRRHYVVRPKGEKKDWAGFFREISRDTVNTQVLDILDGLLVTNKVDEIVFATGRDDTYRKVTTDWLEDHVGKFEGDDYKLYMRNRHDSRRDDIVKEIILDYEILTRFEPYLMMDDRDQVVAMWRRRGFKCFQVAPGDF